MAPQIELYMHFRELFKQANQNVHRKFFVFSKIYSSKIYSLKCGVFLSKAAFWSRERKRKLHYAFAFLNSHTNIARCGYVKNCRKLAHLFWKTTKINSRKINFSYSTEIFSFTFLCLLQVLCFYLISFDNKKQ